MYKHLLHKGGKTYITNKKSFQTRSASSNSGFNLNFHLLEQIFPLFTLSLQNKKFSDLHFGNFPITDSSIFFFLSLKLFSIFSNIYLFPTTGFSTMDECHWITCINLNLFPWCSSWGYCPPARLSPECEWNVSFIHLPRPDPFNATSYNHL